VERKFATLNAISRRESPPELILDGDSCGRSGLFHNLHHLEQALAGARRPEDFIVHGSLDAPQERHPGDPVG
jgi:hypothetical protein